jgi:hypothetical protein
VSRDIVDISIPSDSLVVAAGIEGEPADQLAGALVKDTDVQIGHEKLDRPALVGSADADVVQPAVVAKGDGAAGVGLVLADSEMGLRPRAGQAAGP